MITGYFTDISKLQEGNLFSLLLAGVGDITRKNILSYASREEQWRKLCGKLLLRKLFAAYDLGPHFNFDQLEHNEWGKPYIDHDFGFNISHSGSMVVCAGATGMQIGVDTEKMEYRELEDMRTYFTLCEWQKINDSEDSNTVFYNMWVRKEACLKAAGKGLLLPLREVDVIVDEVKLNGATWFLQDLSLKEGYATCIASARQEPINMVRVEIETLLTK